MKINLDKKVHFLIGFAAGFSAGIVGNPGVGALLGMGAGVYRELWNKYVQKTTFDPNDMMYTFYGAWIGSVSGGILHGIYFKYIK